jgi:ABC-2 type transport system permease protein
MNRNLFLMEIRRNTKGFLVWFAIIALCVISTFGVIPTFMEGQEELLSAYPDEVKLALGIDAAAWDTTLGVYSTYYAFFFPLLGAMFAISLASSIISKEEGKKTAEFLLVKPITRAEIVTSKLAVYMTLVTALWIGVSLMELVGLYFMGSDSPEIGSYFTMSFYGYLLILLFGCVGMVVSLFIKRGRSVLGLSVGIVLISYLFDVMAKLSEKASKLAAISPFHYLDTSVAAETYGLQAGNVMFFVAASALCLVATFVLYRRKDIYV